MTHQHLPSVQCPLAHQPRPVPSNARWPAYVLAHGPAPLQCWLPLCVHRKWVLPSQILSASWPVHWTSRSSAPAHNNGHSILGDTRQPTGTYPQSSTPMRTKGHDKCDNNGGNDVTMTMAMTSEKIISSYFLSYYNCHRQVLTPCIAYSRYWYALSHVML